MAGSINKVILVGNLGADPEIRRTNGSDPIASFRIATSESWKDKDSGERKERTEWHSVVVFNQQLAEVVERYARKGAKVYVEGQQRTRKWQGTDGIDRYVTETVLDRFRGEFQLLDKMPSNRPPAATDAQDYGSVRSGTSQPQQSSAKALDDEIPF